MKKKIMAIFTAFIVAMTILIPHYANATEPNNSETVYKDLDGNICVTKEINELELIKELLKNDDQTLIDLGLSQEEINRYKQFVSQSKARNSQIKTGKLTYTVKWYKDSFKYSKGKTYIKSNLSWSWSTKPIVVETDIVAMGTNENFAVKSGSAKGHVNYYLKGSKTTANKTVISKTVYTKGNGTCAYFKFPMLQTREPGPQLKYALGGSMTVEWVKSGNIKFVAIGGNYGHSTLSINPEVSISGTGVGISFTPSKSIKTGAEALINASR